MDISAARQTIRSRLITALREEELIPQDTPIPPDEDPVMVLRKLRSELTVPATNFDRAAAELADSVVGLARAREGVARRYLKQRIVGRQYLRSAREVADFLIHSMRGLKHEVLTVVFLDAAHAVITSEVVAGGTVQRVIFR